MSVLADAPNSTRGAHAGGGDPIEFSADGTSLWSPMSESPYGEPTLDDLVAGVWEELAVRGLARCPICGGEMHAGITPVELVDAAGLAETGEQPHAILRGACRDCGTELD
jgi:hypothetical protein